MTTSLTDQLGAKLRAELIRPKGQDEHDGVLRDATAFNMAVSAKDNDTIRNLARKYGVKTPPKTGDEPKPKNGSGDMPVDSDEIAGKVLEGLKPYLATDNDGNVTKAASQADLVALTKRVNGIDSHLGRQDGPNGPVYAPIVGNEPFNFTTFLWWLVGGILAGLAVGGIFLWLNTTTEEVFPAPFGPIGGMFIGGTIGALIGIGTAMRTKSH